jgi:RNA polymerase sigma factor (sigma-70 family)
MQVALRYYEGLVCATARRCAAFSEDDAEDIAQLVRVKVWKALRAYDPAQCRTTRDKYVFMCVRDRAKDVVKKKKRGDLHIEDLRHTPNVDNALNEAFDARYLCSSRDDNYAFIEDDDTDILDDLDELERSIVALMMTGDFIHTELADALGVTRAEVERAMKSIRRKLRPAPDPGPENVINLPTANEGSEPRKATPARGQGRSMSIAA